MSASSSSRPPLKPSLFTPHEQLVIHQCAMWLLAEDEKRLRMLLNETADVKLQAKTHLLNADSFLKKEIDACETRLLEMEQKDEDLRLQLDEATRALHIARQMASEKADSQYNPRHHTRNVDAPYSPSVNTNQHKHTEKANAALPLQIWTKLESVIMHKDRLSTSLTRLREVSSIVSRLVSNVDESFDEEELANILPAPAITSVHQYAPSPSRTQPTSSSSLPPASARDSDSDSDVSDAAEASESSSTALTPNAAPSAVAVFISTFAYRLIMARRREHVLFADIRQLLNTREAVNTQLDRLQRMVREEMRAREGERDSVAGGGGMGEWVILPSKEHLNTTASSSLGQAHAHTHARAHSPVHSRLSHASPSASPAASLSLSSHVPHNTPTTPPEHAALTPTTSTSSSSTSTFAAAAQRVRGRVLPTLRQYSTQGFRVNIPSPAPKSATGSAGGAGGSSATPTAMPGTVARPAGCVVGTAAPSTPTPMVGSGAPSTPETLGAGSLPATPHTSARTPESRHIPIGATTASTSDAYARTSLRLASSQPVGGATVASETGRSLGSAEEDAEEGRDSMQLSEGDHTSLSMALTPHTHAHMRTPTLTAAAPATGSAPAHTTTMYTIAPSPLSPVVTTSSNFLSFFSFSSAPSTPLLPPPPPPAALPLPPPPSTTLSLPFSRLPLRDQAKELARTRRILLKVCVALFRGGLLQSLGLNTEVEEDEEEDGVVSLAPTTTTTTIAAQSTSSSRSAAANTTANTPNSHRLLRGPARAISGADMLTWLCTAGVVPSLADAHVLVWLLMRVGVANAHMQEEGAEGACAHAGVVRAREEVWVQGRWGNGGDEAVKEGVREGREAWADDAWSTSEDGHPVAAGGSGIGGVGGVRTDALWAADHTGRWVDITRGDVTTTPTVCHAMTTTCPHTTTEATSSGLLPSRWLFPRPDGMLETVLDSEARLRRCPSLLVHSCAHTPMPLLRTGEDYGELSLRALRDKPGNNSGSADTNFHAQGYTSPSTSAGAIDSDALTPVTSHHHAVSGASLLTPSDPDDPKAEPRNDLRTAVAATPSCVCACGQPLHQDRVAAFVPAAVLAGAPSLLLAPRVHVSGAGSVSATTLIAARGPDATTVAGAPTASITAAAASVSGVHPPALAHALPKPHTHPHSSTAMAPTRSRPASASASTSVFISASTSPSTSATTSTTPSPPIPMAAHAPRPPHTQPTPLSPLPRPAHPRAQRQTQAQTEMQVQVQPMPSDDTQARGEAVAAAGGAPHTAPTDTPASTTMAVEVPTPTALAPASSPVIGRTYSCSLPAGPRTPLLLSPLLLSTLLLRLPTPTVTPLVHAGPLVRVSRWRSVQYHAVFHSAYATLSLYVDAAEAAQGAAPSKQYWLGGAVSVRALDAVKNDKQAPTLAPSAAYAYTDNGNGSGSGSGGNEGELSWNASLSFPPSTEEEDLDMASVSASSSILSPSLFRTQADAAPPRANDALPVAFPSFSPSPAHSYLLITFAEPQHGDAALLLYCTAPQARKQWLDALWAGGCPVPAVRDAASEGRLYAERMVKVEGLRRRRDAAVHVAMDAEAEPEAEAEVGAKEGDGKVGTKVTAPSHASKPPSDTSVDALTASLTLLGSAIQPTHTLPPHCEPVRGVPAPYRYDYDEDLEDEDGLSNTSAGAKAVLRAALAALVEGQACEDEHGDVIFIEALRAQTQARVQAPMRSQVEIEVEAGPEAAVEVEAGACTPTAADADALAGAPLSPPVFTPTASLASLPSLPSLTLPGNSTNAGNASGNDGNTDASDAATAATATDITAHATRPPTLPPLLAHRWPVAPPPLSALPLLTTAAHTAVREAVKAVERRCRTSAREPLLTTTALATPFAAPSSPPSPLHTLARMHPPLYPPPLFVCRGPCSCPWPSPCATLKALALLALAHTPTYTHAHAHNDTHASSSGVEGAPASLDVFSRTYMHALTHAQAHAHVRSPLAAEVGVGTGVGGNVQSARMSTPAQHHLASSLPSPLLSLLLPVAPSLGPPTPPTLPVPSASRELALFRSFRLLRTHHHTMYAVAAAVASPASLAALSLPHMFTFAETLALARAHTPTAATVAAVGVSGSARDFIASLRARLFTSTDSTASSSSCSDADADPCSASFAGPSTGAGGVAPSSPSTPSLLSAQLLSRTHSRTARTPMRSPPHTPARHLASPLALPLTPSVDRTSTTTIPAADALLSGPLLKLCVDNRQLKPLATSVFDFAAEDELPRARAPEAGRGAVSELAATPVHKRDDGVSTATTTAVTGVGSARACGCGLCRDPALAAYAAIPHRHAYTSASPLPLASLFDTELDGTDAVARLLAQYPLQPSRVQPPPAHAPAHAQASVAGAGAADTPLNTTASASVADTQNDLFSGLCQPPFIFPRTAPAITPVPDEDPAPVPHTAWSPLPSLSSSASMGAPTPATLPAPSLPHAITIDPDARLPPLLLPPRASALLAALRRYCALSEDDFPPPPDDVDPESLTQDPLFPPRAAIPALRALSERVVRVLLADLAKIANREERVAVATLLAQHQALLREYQGRVEGLLGAVAEAVESGACGCASACASGDAEEEARGDLCADVTPAALHAAPCLLSSLCATLATQLSLLPPLLARIRILTKRLALLDSSVALLLPSTPLSSLLLLFTRFYNLTYAPALHLVPLHPALARKARRGVYTSRACTPAPSPSHAADPHTNAGTAHTAGSSPRPSASAATLSIATSASASSAGSSPPVPAISLHSPQETLAPVPAPLLPLLSSSLASLSTLTRRVFAPPLASPHAITHTLAPHLHTILSLADDGRDARSHAHGPASGPDSGSGGCNDAEGTVTPSSASPSLCSSSRAVSSHTLSPLLSPLLSLLPVAPHTPASTLSSCLLSRLLPAAPSLAPLTLSSLLAPPALNMPFPLPFPNPHYLLTVRRAALRDIQSVTDHITQLLSSQCVVELVPARVASRLVVLTHPHARLLPPTLAHAHADLHAAMQAQPSAPALPPSLPTPAQIHAIVSKTVARVLSTLTAATTHRLAQAQTAYKDWALAARARAFALSPVRSLGMAPSLAFDRFSRTLVATALEAASGDDANGKGTSDQGSGASSDTSLLPPPTPITDSLAPTLASALQHPLLSPYTPAALRLALLPHTPCPTDKLRVLCSMAKVLCACVDAAVGLQRHLTSVREVRRARAHRSSQQHTRTPSHTHTHTTEKSTKTMLSPLLGPKTPLPPTASTALPARARPLLSSPSTTLPLHRDRSASVMLCDCGERACGCGRLQMPVVKEECVELVSELPQLQLDAPDTSSEAEQAGERKEDGGVSGRLGSGQALGVRAQVSPLLAGVGVNVGMPHMSLAPQDDPLALTSPLSTLDTDADPQHVAASGVPAPHAIACDVDMHAGAIVSQSVARDDRPSLPRPLFPSITASSSSSSSASSPPLTRSLLGSPPIPSPPLSALPLPPLSPLPVPTVPLSPALPTSPSPAHPPSSPLWPSLPPASTLPPTTKPPKPVVIGADDLLVLVAIAASRAGSDKHIEAAATAVDTTHRELTSILANPHTPATTAAPPVCERARRCGDCGLQRCVCGRGVGGMGLWAELQMAEDAMSGNDRFLMVGYYVATAQAACELILTHVPHEEESEE